MWHQQWWRGLSSGEKSNLKNHFYRNHYKKVDPSQKQRHALKLQCYSQHLMPVIKFCHLFVVNNKAPNQTSSLPPRSNAEKISHPLLPKLLRCCLGFRLLMITKILQKPQALSTALKITFYLGRWIQWIFIHTV